MGGGREGFEAEGALHLILRGRVQGVGFRYFVLKQARRLGLRGYVRNLYDGGVEIVAEGPRAALERLLQAARQGPPGARVTEVQLTWREPSQAFRQFDVRF